MNLDLDLDWFIHENVSSRLNPEIVRITMRLRELGRPVIIGCILQGKLPSQMCSSVRPTLIYTLVTILLIANFPLELHETHKLVQIQTCVH